jgi:hypothetical protein
MRRDDAILAGAAAALAAGVRLPLISESFWRDEGSTYAVVHADSLRGVLEGIHRGELTPPLYFLLEHAWIALAGTSEAAMRVPSLIFSVLAVVTLYALAKLVASRLAAVIISVVAAISPVYLSAGMEARAYGLTVMLSALTLYFFARISRAQQQRDRVFYASAFALSAAALDATQFTGFVFLGVLFVAAAALTLSDRSANAYAILAGVCAAAVLSAPLIPLFLIDSSHYHGVMHPYLGTLQTLDDHLNAFSPFGSMIPQSDRFLEGGLLVWIAVLLWRRTFSDRDAWIALCAGVLAAGITASIVRHISLERHLLAYAAPAWLLMALLLERFTGWIFERTSAALTIWKTVTALLLIYIAGSGLLEYPRIYAHTIAPTSGSRALVSALIARENGQPTLLVALPDNIGPALWYYARSDRRITLRGVATWMDPEWYSFYDRKPWLQPNFTIAEADRVDALARNLHAQIALAISPHPVYYNAMPFYRARYVAELLEKRHGVAYRAEFEGWREPLELVLLKQPKPERPL